MVSAFNNLDISLEEASLDLGMSSLQTFRIIILPMVSPGLISSLLIGFVISLDEFIIAFFLLVLNQHYQSIYGLNLGSLQNYQVQWH